MQLIIRLMSSKILMQMIDLKKYFLLMVLLLPRQSLYAASYEWGASANIQFMKDTGDAWFWLDGTITQNWNGIADACGQGMGYRNSGALYLKQYDRKTTPVGDDNVIFVLAVYGELLSADTIESATKLPLCTWDTHEHSGGVTIEDPTDFYLGFVTPESKTADGIPRYGWYHLSIDDDLNDITLLDSGVGLYGESIYVGMGTTPEPSSGLLVLMGFAVLSLKRKFGGT